MKTKNKKGFSLIELLIIISIISIMTTVSITSLMSNKAQKEVESAAREVAAAIREAQGYSLTGRSSRGENLCATRFGIQSTSNYRLLYASTTSGISCPTGAPTYNKTYYSKSLKNGVTFNSYTSSTVDFAVPYGVMTPAGTVAITLIKGGFSRKVCVYSPTGRVEEKKEGESC